MKKKYLIVCLIFVGGLISSCSSNGLYQTTLITEGNHQLSGTTSGDLIILGGKTALGEDATVEGSTHVISGLFRLNGEIHGDLSFLGGEVILGPQGQIGGDFNYGGGDLSNLNQDAVSGTINVGTGIRLPALETQRSQNPGGLVIRWVINATMLGVLTLFLYPRLPRPFERISEAALRHLLVSLAMGLLVGIVGISLVVVMAYTILLIPVALIGLVLLGAAVILGWIACGFALGRLAADYLKIGKIPKKYIFGGTFILMLLVGAITEIPLVGGIFGILVASISLGAVFLTRFGMLRFIPESTSSS